jgi:hypothetical protein
MKQRSRKDSLEPAKAYHSKGVHSQMAVRQDTSHNVHDMNKLGIQSVESYAHAVEEDRTPHCIGCSHNNWATVGIPCKRGEGSGVAVRCEGDPGSTS